MTDKLFSRGDNNSVYYILKAIQLLLSYRKSNSFSDILTYPELLSYSENNLEQVGKILSIRDLRRTAWHFLDYGASTALILQHRLGITEPTTYRYIKDLGTFKFIVPAIKARGGTRKRGPRTRVWMVPDATTDHINDAQRLHRNLTSPKYLYAEKMAQLMLEEYVLVKGMTEITRVEYIKFLRDRKVKTSTIPDIVMISIPYFKEQGIRLSM